MIKRNKYSEFSRNQKLTLASSGLGYAMENMDIVFLALALPAIMAQLKISSTAGGLIITITNIAKLIGAVIFGILADTYSRVKMFTYSLVLIALATATIYFTNDIYVIYICRFLTGLGAGGEYGIGVTLVAENFKGHKIGSLLSNTLSLGMISVIIASLLATVILPNYGWHTLFLVGLLPIILAFIVRRHLKENPDFVNNVKSHKNKTAPLRELFGTPRLAWQTIAIIIMTAAIACGYSFFSWLPAIMEKELKMNASSSSFILMPICAGVFVGMIVFGKLLNNYGPRIAFSIFLIGGAISVYALLIPVHNLISLIIITLVIGFFVGSTYSGYGVIISKLYPMNIRATANSFIMSLGYAICGGIAPVTFGALMDNFSLICRSIKCVRCIIGKSIGNDEYS